MDNPILQKKLLDSSVGIAGAGGLGSNVAMALARAGVGTLVSEARKGSDGRTIPGGRCRRGGL